MTPTTVYYSPYCPFCIMAFRLLEQRGVDDPEKIRVDNDPERKEEMVRRSGRRTVPQIFIGPVHVGGCDELHALDRSGELAEILGRYSDKEGATNEDNA